MEVRKTTRDNIITTLYDALNSIDKLIASDKKRMTDAQTLSLIGTVARITLAEAKAAVATLDPPFPVCALPR